MSFTKQVKKHTIQLTAKEAEWFQSIYSKVLEQENPEVAFQDEDLKPIHMWLSNGNGKSLLFDLEIENSNNQ